MQLVIATPLYPPEPGGPATYAKLLEDGLPKEGIEVTMVKFGDVRKYPKFLRHFVYYLRVAKAAKHADLILVQDTVSCGIPALVAARITNTPLIVRVPGDYAWEQGRQRYGVTADLDAFQKVRAPFPVQVLQFLQRSVVRGGKAVIVPSEYFAKIVGGWGVASERLHVVYHGVALPEVLPQPSKPPGKLMVSAGRLVPWKGFPLLIELLTELPEWRLAIVGDGPEREALAKLAEKLGVQDRVVFLGNLPRAEALGWCKAANAFVLNTSFESFSFQIVEAMMLGVPVITTNIGSIPELLTHNQEGVLLTPNAREEFKVAIESTQTASEEWKVHTAAAQKKASQFSLATMLPKTVAIIKQSV